MKESQDFERDLTPSEIEERTALHLQLAKQHAENTAAVDVRRKEIRTLNAERKKLDVRSAQVLREITTRKVLETRQASLGLDVSVPDPFRVRYPMAADHERLHASLAVVLQDHGGGLVPSLEKLERWHPSTPEFQMIAHWARTELAYMNRKEHKDLELPPRLPLPEPLAQLRMFLARKSAPRKKRAQPMKARPASGTPVRARRKR